MSKIQAENSIVKVHSDLMKADKEIKESLTQVSPRCRPPPAFVPAALPPLCSLQPASCRCRGNW